MCAPRGRRQSPPYLMENVKPRDDGLAREGNDRYEGYCVDLADEISAGPIQRRVSRSFSVFVNPPAANPARPRTPRPGLHGPGLHGPVLHGPGLHGTRSGRADERLDDLAEEMFAHILRVPHRLQIVRDGKYGGKTATGEWNGMIGELTNRVRRKMRRGTRPDPGFCRGGIQWKKS